MIDIIIPTCKEYKDVESQIAELVQNTEIEYKLIVTCQKASSSWNRNFGLNCSNAEYIIMIDDDIFGFKKGWAATLIDTLQDQSICMVSGRCMMPDGVSMAPVGHCEYRMDPEIIDIPRLKEGILPSSIIAFRKTHLRFDINIIGAGFEDADICFQMYEYFKGEKRFVVNNKCKVIHTNERKGYGGRKEYKTFDAEVNKKVIPHNRRYFHKKWYETNRLSLPKAGGNICEKDYFD